MPTNSTNQTVNPWILLIIQYGVEGAYAIWKEWQNVNEPTEEMWQRLLAIGQKTSAQYKAEAIAELNKTYAPSPTVSQ